MSVQSSHTRRPNETATFSVCVGIVRVSGLRHGKIEVVSCHDNLDLFDVPMWTNLINGFVLHGRLSLDTILHAVSTLTYLHHRASPICSRRIWCYES